MLKPNQPATGSEAPMSVSTMLCGRPSISCRSCGFSECPGVGFAGADAHRAFEPEDEDFAVADLAGLRGRRNGIDSFVHLIGRYGDLDLDFGFWAES